MDIIKTTFKIFLIFLIFSCFSSNNRILELDREINSLEYLTIIAWVKEYPEMRNTFHTLYLNDRKLYLREYEQLEQLYYQFKNKKM